MKLRTLEHRAVGALALLLLGLLIAGVAGAATVTVTGTHPTTNTDGSTIDTTGQGALTNRRIEYGTCNGTAFGTKVGEVTRPAGAPGSTFSDTLNLNPGTSCVRVFVANGYGRESDASNVVSKVVQPPTPNPPQLTATAPQAYDVVPNERTFAFERGRQVGTVKLGAACDEDRTTGDDFYALERPSRVKLTRNPRSTALVAKCGQVEGISSGSDAVEAEDLHLDAGRDRLVRGVHDGAAG